MPITSREMINYLVDNGFKIINQTGSHVKLRNKETSIFKIKTGCLWQPIFIFEI